MESSTSRPGQLAAAIAKAHPRQQAAAGLLPAVDPTAQSVSEGLVPDGGAATEAFSKLIGREPSGHQTEDRPG